MRHAGGSFCEHLQRRVLEFIQERCGVDGGARAVVAVSGGADSLCLLHVMSRLSGSLELTFHVAHMDHMLRGCASREDAAFVAEQARILGLECTVEAHDIRAYRSERRSSLEEAAREVRYQFLRRVAEKCGAAVVMTGHTREDAVETVMLHLLRGSGVHGLRGLEPVSAFPSPSPQREGVESLRLVRPLVPVSREETVAYCRHLGLSYREDTSNECVDFLRNRIRLKVIPELRQANPRFDEAVLRLAESAAEDDDCITALAGDVWVSGVTCTPASVTMDLRSFKSSHPAVQTRLVCRAMVHLTGSARDVTRAHIVAVRELATGMVGRQVDLPRGVTWRRGYATLMAFQRGTDPEAEDAKALEKPMSLNVPGETWLPGWKVVAACSAPHGDVVAQRYVAHLDKAKVGTHLTVRRRRPGDRFQPLGMAGEKKLQDFMVDEKIPQRSRDSVPVVCSGDDVVWLVGWRIDDRCRVTASTEEVVRLEFEPVPEHRAY